MTMEKIKGENQILNTVVDHFHSMVVEAITLLSSYYYQSKEGESFLLEKDISTESSEFLRLWNKESPFDFFHFLNLLIPCPYFHDMELFVESLEKLSQEDYVYHFFDEDLEMDSVKELLNNPSEFIAGHDNILWDSELKKGFLIKFIEHMNEYRMASEQLLLEIATSSDFLTILNNKQESIEGVMQQVRSLSMEPLTLAQYLMGKNFRRVSNYRIYYFIPSYFTTRKMRFFNSEICIVIYSSANLISDDLQNSKDLDAQLKALADPNRLLLLRLLSNQKLYGARLAEYLGVTTATVSHHLDLLKKANFIAEEKVGTIKYFTSNQENINKFLNELKKFTGTN